ncbi:MAG: TetR/AcrR family transcriptional regulator [Clostridiales bacterium]|nr:TetR/AcrR family transcriptional regulator [Clostridiales bacterium]
MKKTCIISLNEHSVKRRSVLEKKTRRQEQAQERRQRLLAAALALFSQRGYAATSVHAICDGLGVADSLLYHYFPGGKKELMQVLIQENMLQLLNELNAQKDFLENLPVTEMLEALYQGIDRTVMRYADLFRIIIREGEIREWILDDQLRLVMKKRQQWFAHLLAVQAERGQIAPMDFESAAEMLDSLMLYHLAAELMGVGDSRLKDDHNRKRWIDYQVGLWQRGQ